MGISASNLNFPIINGSGFRLKFNSGDGDRRLVAVTEGTDIKYPLNGTKYKSDLKFSKGDPLFSTTNPNGMCINGTCSPLPCNPITDPTQSTSVEHSNTYVVYEGFSDGSRGIDILNLKPQTQYSVVVYENTGYCYTASDPIYISTGFRTNSESADIRVYDSRTRKPIHNASIAIMNSDQFISDTGKTDESGIYRTLRLEEGRYEISIMSSGYSGKILTGVFIQREEPRRDSYYRIFTSAGNTEMGSSVVRDYYKNKNTHIAFLDRIDSTSSSYSKYNASPNPSNITKL